MVEKKLLALEELESQVALELPDRRMPALVNVILIDVLSGNQAAVAVPIGIAANVCNISVAAVLAAAASSSTGTGCTADVSHKTFQKLTR